MAGTRNWPSPPGSSPAGKCPTTISAPSTALIMIQPAFTDAERLALAGFLAGYRGLTRYAVEEELLDHSPAATSVARESITSRTPSPWTATSGAQHHPAGRGRLRDLSTRRRPVGP